MTLLYGIAVHVAAHRRIPDHIRKMEEWGGDDPHYFGVRAVVQDVRQYAAVDRLPIARLSTDDLWTLLLIVAVPWNREQLSGMEAESAILRKFVGDTIGSRKLIMSIDESVRELLGPVVGSASMWYPTSDDPLRDQLRALIKNPEDLQALDVLFKKRLSAEDFDRLVSALGRKL